MTLSDIDYARAGDTHVAYRVVGEPGRVDVVMVAGALFPLELLEEDRIASRFTADLAALGRLVVFDKRGIPSLCGSITSAAGEPRRARWLSEDP